MQFFFKQHLGAVMVWNHQSADCSLKDQFHCCAIFAVFVSVDAFQPCCYCSCRPHAWYAKQGLCNGRVSVSPSVCLSHWSTAAGGFAAERRTAGYISYHIIISYKRFISYHIIMSYKRFIVRPLFLFPLFYCYLNVLCFQVCIFTVLCCFYA